MRHDYRTASVAAVAALAWSMIGFSAADDRDGLFARVAQATETPIENPPAGAPGARSEAAATVLDQQDVQSILGRQVLSSAGEDMGRVIDIVVDRAGQVRAAVIDFGGFLGLGNRKVAIDWGALRFAPTGSKSDRITVELTRDQVKAATEYRDGRPLVVLGAADPLSSTQY
jgi:sporulation protein YlmC with PRC-barrel domain